jgi:hypothetical protein
VDQVSDEMGDEKRDPGSIEWTDVVGGAVLGLVGSWGLYAVAMLVLYTSLGDNAAPWVYALVGVGALFAIPLCAGAVLIRRGRGQLGSGLLLGVAIGSIIGAGVCSTTWLGQ